MFGRDCDFGVVQVEKRVASRYFVRFRIVGISENVDEFVVVETRKHSPLEHERDIFESVFARDAKARSCSRLGVEGILSSPLQQCGATVSLRCYKAAQIHTHKPSRTHIVESRRFISSKSSSQTLARASASALYASGPEVSACRALARLFVLEQEYKVRCVGTRAGLCLLQHLGPTVARDGAPERHGSHVSNAIFSAKQTVSRARVHSAFENGAFTICRFRSLETLCLFDRISIHHHNRTCRGIYVYTTECIAITHIYTTI